MSQSVSRYVALTVAAAIVCTGVVVALGPGVGGASVSRTLILLALIAASAEKLRIEHAGGGYSSFASWPLAAAFLIAPNWGAVAAAIFASSLMQIVARRMWVKAVFNVAQTALTIGVAILVFRLLGGVPPADLDSVNWLDSAVRSSRADGVAALLAILVYLFSQTLCVVGVLALADRKRLVDVWKSDFEQALSTTMLAIPIIPWFAWQTVHSGILTALVPSAALLAIWRLLLEKRARVQTHEDLLTVMVASIESRDPYTSGHSQRVETYSRIIGRALGLRADELERLGIAALLHDVGKALPKHASWIKSPKQLSSDERRVMEEHPQDGATLVAKAQTLGDIVLPVLHHHENWDGSGYPKQLDRARIPVHARIIRVADAIDAMTTVRPYKPRRSAAEVSAELQQFSGTQFDPEIVRALLNSPQWGALRRELERFDTGEPLAIPPRQVALVRERSMGSRVSR